MRFSPEFKRQAYDWLLYGRADVPPPWSWKAVAWLFLVAGFGLYIAAIGLVVSGSLLLALGAVVVGFVLRRQVRLVAPQLLYRMGEEVLEEDERESTVDPQKGQFG